MRYDWYGGAMEPAGAPLASGEFDSPTAARAWAMACAAQLHVRMWQLLDETERYVAHAP